MKWKVLKKSLLLLFRDEKGIVDHKQYDYTVRYLYRFGIGESDPLDGFRLYFYNKIFYNIFKYMDIAKYTFSKWYELNTNINLREFYFKKFWISFKIKKFLLTLNVIFYNISYFLLNLILIYYYILYLYLYVYFIKGNLILNKEYYLFFYRHFLKDILYTYYFFELYSRYNIKKKLVMSFWIQIYLFYWQWFFLFFKKIK